MNLDDRLDHDVSAWRPDPGDKLTGTIVDVSTRPSKYGEDYPYLEVRTDEGEVLAVHGFHTVLRNELERLQPKRGDGIGIRYSGQKPLKSGGTCESYRVIIEATDKAAVPSPNWDELKPEARDDVQDDAANEPF